MAARALKVPEALGQHLSEPSHHCIPCFGRRRGESLCILDLLME